MNIDNENKAIIPEKINKKYPLFDDDEQINEVYFNYLLLYFLFTAML